MEKGHLQINKNIITWLTDLHLQLLRSPKFPYYNSAYYKVLPYICLLYTSSNVSRPLTKSVIVTSFTSKRLLSVKKEPMANAKWPICSIWQDLM